MYFYLCGIAAFQTIFSKILNALGKLKRRVAGSNPFRSYEEALVVGVGQHNLRL